MGLLCPVVNGDTEIVTEVIWVQRHSSAYPSRPAPTGDEWATLGRASEEVAKWFKGFPIAADEWPFALEIEYAVADGRRGEVVRVAAVAAVADGFVVRAHYRLGATGPWKVEYLHPDGLELTERMRRQLGLGRVMEEVERWRSDPRIVKHFLGTEWGRAVRRPGRRGADLHYYAVIACRYLRACAESPQAPYPTMLVDGRSDPGATKEALRSAVRRARATGVLTPAEGKKAGGALTELGERLAREMGEEVPT
jgi:hypothetical protein